MASSPPPPPSSLPLNSTPTPTSTPTSPAPPPSALRTQRRPTYTTSPYPSHIPTSSLTQRRRRSAALFNAGSSPSSPIASPGTANPNANPFEAQLATLSLAGALNAPTFASNPFLTGPGVDSDCERTLAELDEQDDIAQAMALLSIGAGGGGGGGGGGVRDGVRMGVEAEKDEHWPDPENLLKESLRQSLQALRALRMAKRMGAEGKKAEEYWAVHGAVTEMRGAAEVLRWAEVETGKVLEGARERGLKG